MQPVYLRRVDGHAALINDVAAALCGLHDLVGDLNGGEVVRGADGRPTGLLKCAVSQSLKKSNCLLLRACPHDPCSPTTTHTGCERS